MSEEFPGYEESLKELNKILQRLTSGEVGMDEVSDLVKRASFLLEKCQIKLRKIEKELDDTFDSE